MRPPPSRTTIIVMAMLAACLLLPSCSLDGFLFNTQELADYDLRENVIPASAREAVTLTSGGHTLYGFFVRQPDSLQVEPHPVVIYNHGNKHHLGEYWDRVELLYQCGFDVFIYDYRGFGKSTGTSSETGLAEDAAAAWNYVYRRPDVDTNWIACYGYSLGGVPASVMAATLGKPRVLVMEATFSDGEGLVRSGTLLDIPGAYLLEGEFDNEARMPLVTCPVLFLHGTDDAFLPIANSHRLYNAATSPRTLVEVQHAGHENVPDVMGHTSYRDIITAFVRAN